MLTPEGERREIHQRRAIVDAMGPLTERETIALLLAFTQCAADLRRCNPVAASNFLPEQVALLAAYEVTASTPLRKSLAMAAGMTDDEAAALCRRIRTAAGAVAADQGRRSVLEAFAILDDASDPDRPSRR